MYYSSKQPYIIFLAFLFIFQLKAQNVSLDPSWAQDPPAINQLIKFADEQSEMRIVLKRYNEDLASLNRRYPIPFSPAKRERLRKFVSEWKKAIGKVSFNNLSHEGQIDYVLLDHSLDYLSSTLDLDEKNWKEISAILPFADSLRILQENRFDRKGIDSKKVAGTLDTANDQIIELNSEVKEGHFKQSVAESQAMRAAQYIGNLIEILKDWNKDYDGFDPEYDFWVRTPFKEILNNLKVYQETINRDLVGIQPGNKWPIVGDAVGEEGLKAALEYQMIPYNAQELLKIAEREFAWTVDQFKKVSNDMGYNDNWPAALEHVKELAPRPGTIKDVLYDIAEYSFDYIENLGFVTISPLEREVWRLRMRSAEEQRRAAFFLGGEYTSASYPMEEMDHKFKMMSMRGNTPYFNFPTVQHELIPGHYHQFFVSSRFNTQRSRLYNTPFWLEGNAFYWETLLWDQGDFARSNEDKIGMLFWRLHRAARIIFTLNFHLGNWTPQQCVEFLVNEVHHERSNAESEVRPAIQPDRPLYRLAYMLGALQQRVLFKEAVMDGNMDPRDYHDAVLQGGSMPIEMVRVRILKKPLKRNYKSNWRWDDNYDNETLLKL